MAGGVKMMNHIWNKVYNFLNELRCENKSESIVVQLENCSKEKDILESQMQVYQDTLQKVWRTAGSILSGDSWLYSNNDGNGIDKIRKVDLMVDENMVYKNGKSVQANWKITRTDFFLWKSIYFL